MRTDSALREPSALSEKEQEAVREQMNRLLANPFFSHSRRFPIFLRFVVEQTLAGAAENIKERTLGVEIFGRDAEYDTSVDPIVRVTAAEIRKRVAQYYQDPGHEREMRITLPQGSYIPQFHWPRGGNDAVHQEPDPASAETAANQHPPLASGQAHGRRHSSLILLLGCVTAGVLSVGSVLLWQAMHRSALDFFWQPVVTANGPVLLCVADQTESSGQSLRDASDPTRQVQLKPMSRPKDNLTTVAIDDLSDIVRIAGLLQSNGKQYNLRGEGVTSLADLRSGPAVFIGAFDNAWTLRLTNPLRYHFSNNADMTEVRIVDSTAPAQSRWVVESAVQIATNNYRDYAIVARFTDTNTGKLTVIVAGLARGGTIAAGEFLTDSDDMAQLQRAALAAGNKKNMEIVLSTQIIDGEPGSPKMEAAYFW
jgi:hypothetical protein